MLSGCSHQKRSCNPREQRGKVRCCFEKLVGSVVEQPGFGSGIWRRQAYMAINVFDKAESSFFSHNDPAMVEWFVKMVEERKHQHDSSKEKKNW